MALPPDVAELLMGLSSGDAPGDPKGRITAPDGRVVELPCFRSAEGWTVRFRTPVAGRYDVDFVAADNVVSRSLMIDEIGPAGVVPHLVANGRQLAASDGEPFLWLADTWWFALCDRVGIDELRELASARRAAGYNVVQVVAGLLPEVEPFDDLGELAAGWPWTPGFEELNLSWWEAADQRLQMIIAEGLLPAVVGSWSYYMDDMGPELAIRHWREIIARWGAYPVVWCIAGEAGLPHYDQIGAPDVLDKSAVLAGQWEQVAAAVGRLDGYANLRTVHPWPLYAWSSTTTFSGTAELELAWLQTGHMDRTAIVPSMVALTADLEGDHGLPVINSEVCYEGIAAGSSHSLQRFLFWSHLLSGAAGHSYGAQGLWAFRRDIDPGPGTMWGETSWPEAAALPGGQQLGDAARLLRTLPWSELKASPSTLSIHASAENWVLPYAASSPNCVVAYFPPASLLEPATSFAELTLAGLAAGRWLMRWWNPRRGTDLEVHDVQIDDAGTWRLTARSRRSALPSIEDWVLVAERQ